MAGRPKLQRNLSSLTLADQIQHAISNLEVEGPNALETAVEEEHREWRASTEQPQPADLRKVRLVGEGGYSTVFMVHDERNMRHFALKVMRKGFVASLRLGERVMLEKAAHEELRHPFICQLYTTFQDEDSLYFVLELARGGDLFEIIERMGGRMPESSARHYLGCIALGIQHMHSLGYVYRDLKVQSHAQSLPRGARACASRACQSADPSPLVPRRRRRRAQPENILIDGRGFVKIADLGYCKKIRGGRTYSTIGTDTYTPPELVRGRGRTKAADWWGCGVLLHEMIVGVAPFQGNTSREVLSSVDEYAEGADESNADLRSWLIDKAGSSTRAADLIAGLLRADEVGRLGSSGFRAIQGHAWFSSLDWVALLRRQLPPPYVPPPDFELPDVSHRVDPKVTLDRDWDRQAWSGLFDEFGPKAQLAAE